MKYVVNLLRIVQILKHEDIKQMLKNISRRHEIDIKILHRGEAVLRKHLRSFENQISNIIRRTKGKRSMLKFHQFYSAKKYPKGWA